MQSFLYDIILSMKPITRTHTRTRETMERYIATMKKRREEGQIKGSFLDGSHRIIKEFNHWAIIENEFPYDAIASTSHMIVTKRFVAFDWRLLTPEEEKEINSLKETYLSEHYEVVWENLPKGQTIPTHFHLHLLVLKREE